MSPLTPTPVIASRAHDGSDISRDVPAFQQVYDEHLATPPGVQRRTSTLVMRSVVENRPLPL